MFGHKWESARGTVVETRIEQTTVDGMPGLHQVPVYVIDVREPHGQTVQEIVKGVPGMSPDLAPGTLVSVEINAKTSEVRFHPDHIKANLASVRSDGAQTRVEMTGGGSVTVVRGQGQPGGPGQQPGAGMPQIRVVGGSQAAELMREVLAGGGDRAAALEKVRQLQSETIAQAGAQGQNWTQGQQGPPEQAGPQVQTWARGQHGPPGPSGPVGFSSPETPSTFDQVSPATPPTAPATFSSPASAFGTPSTSSGPSGGGASPPASFSSPPVAPASFEPVTPAGTFGSPAGPGFSGGGSFGASGSFGAFGESKSDRIARLEDQRDRGQLTPEQFQAQRQQILDEI